MEQVDRSRTGLKESAFMLPIAGFETHLLREQGVGSSNLPAPTNYINHLAILNFLDATDTQVFGASKWAR